MTALYEALAERARTVPDGPYRFAVGQRVRIRSTLTTDTHAILDMLGQVGTVESRRTTWLSRIKSYMVRVGNRVEPFEEDELDGRYARKEGCSPIPAPPAPDATMSKRRRKPDPIRPEIRELAARIAADLFTDGRGQRAVRLAMEHQDRQLAGTGWGEGPMADRIAVALAEAWPAPDAETTPR